MRSALYLNITLFLILFCSVMVNSEPVFVSGPTISDEGANISIKFATNEYTDVEVAVLDSNDKVIRHLAAGKLGLRPPVPFTPSSLSQTIYWDKKDDMGRTYAGTFDVKVGLGLMATFSRLYAPDTTTRLAYPILGVTTDADGNVYVLFRVGATIRGITKLVAYDKNGRYLRTLHPYSGYHDESKLKGFGRIKTEDGRYIPKSYMANHPTFFPEFQYPYRSGMAMTKDNRLILCNTGGDAAWYGNHSNITRLLIINRDGTCPGDSIFGPLVRRKYSQSSQVQVALSPSDKEAYVTGLYGVPAVYKVPLSYTTGMARCFFGDTVSGGTDSLKLGRPKGVATDSENRVYITDSLLNRLIVADSSGRLLAIRNVTSADQIHVHPITKAVYVMQLNPVAGKVQITKYSPFPALDSVCSFSTTWDANWASSSKSHPPVFALSVTGVLTRLILSSPLYNDPKLRIITDNGLTLTISTDVIPSVNPSVSWAGATVDAPGYLAVSPDGKTAYVGLDKLNKINLESGAISSSTIRGRDIEYGPNGLLYVWALKDRLDSAIVRYDAAERIVPFNGGRMACSTRVPLSYQGPDFGSRGFTVAGDGSIYVLQAHTGRSGAIHKDNITFLDKYDSTGVLAQDSIIRGNTSTSGIQVDLRGNLYVALNAKPRGVYYPEGIVPTQLPDPLSTSINRPWSIDYSYLNHYLTHYGSIFKFPPSGGSQLLTGTLVTAIPNGTLTADTVPVMQATGMYRYAFEIKGAEWQHLGISPSTGYGEDQGDPTCNCFHARYTVDGFGRVIYPDALRYQVAIIDNNRNMLLRFGEYGNIDQTGPGSVVPSPAIPFCQPMYVRKVNNEIFVSDVGNNRIVKVNLGHTIWKTASGKTGTSIEGLNIAEKFDCSLSPNPFNPSVNIYLHSPVKRNIHVSVYTIRGEWVRDLGSFVSFSGVSRLVWNGDNSSGRLVPSGFYIVKVKAGKNVRNYPCTLLK
ncbi:MAG: hypothetical protein JNL74_03510 [Fibrobacteres bacterium]|nr:hypothetical protein [Fibrobacterota bacterium]